MIVSLPASNLVQGVGANTLTVWTRDGQPGILKKIRVRRSYEAGRLKDAFSPAGVLVDPTSSARTFDGIVNSTLELIERQADDNILNPQEKRIWRTSYIEMAENYDRARNYAVELFGPDPFTELTNLETTWGDFINLLIDYDVWSEPKKDTPISGTTLETYYTEYTKAYQALSEKSILKVAEREAGSADIEEQLTEKFTSEGWDWLIPKGTIIDGQEITTNTIKASALYAGTVDAWLIKAHHIDADSIDVRHLKADVIETDKLVNNSVVTSKVLKDSITAPSGVTLAGHIDIPTDGGWKFVCEIEDHDAITTAGEDGAPVLVTFSCFTWVADGDAVAMEVGLFRDNHLLLAIDQWVWDPAQQKMVENQEWLNSILHDTIFAAWGLESTMTFAFIDSTPSGIHTYTIGARVPERDIGKHPIEVSSRTMTCVSCKR